MKLEKQLVSFGLAEQLFKYLNWTDCLWCYARGHVDEKYKLLLSEYLDSYMDDTIPAYTVAELGEFFYQIAGDEKIEEYVKDKCDETIGYLEFTKADFWAKLLIHLKENKLID